MHSTSAALSQRSSGVSYTNCTPASCRFPRSSTSQTFLQAVNIFHSGTWCQILPRLATSFLTRYAFSTMYRGFTQAAEDRLPPTHWPALAEGPGGKVGPSLLGLPSEPPGLGRLAPAWPNSEGCPLGPAVVPPPSRRCEDTSFPAESRRGCCRQLRGSWGTAPGEQRWLSCARPGGAQGTRWLRGTPLAPRPSPASSSTEGGQPQTAARPHSSLEGRTHCYRASVPRNPSLASSAHVWSCCGTGRRWDMGQPRGDGPALGGCRKESSELPQPREPCG